MGDCADFDDEQSFCVSMCQDYCGADQCQTREPRPCEVSCGSKDMRDRGPYTIDFVKYSMCVAANCTSTPISPYGR